MRRYIYILLISLVCFSLAISGCVAKKKPAPKPAPRTRMTPTPSAPRKAPEPKPSRKPAPAHNEAMKLSKAAEKVEGVKAATVVISDSTAYVGLETKAEVESKKTEEIKTKVADEIKKTDTKIKTVHTTTDPNVLTRIKKVAKGIEEGKPVSGFTEEIAEITRRITPKTK